jgi:CRISPR-associated protein Cmr4
MNHISSLYVIRAVSNLHVGSGNTNYGVIDNLVQRDSINNYPTINSSSMKGALREFFRAKLTENIGESKTELLKETQKNAKEYAIAHIFGNEKKESDGGDKELNAGHFHFHTGHLLSIPVRCSKGAPFVRATTLNILQELEEAKMLFGIHLGEAMNKAIQYIKDIAPHLVEKGKPAVFNAALKDAYLEEQDIKASYTDSLPKAIHEPLVKLLGDNYCIMHNDDFKEIIHNLPVIARNQLNNGESKNLWYEEVVPRETRFFTTIIKDTTCNTTFDEIVTEKQLIQIGANASVGYGKCQFIPL